MNINQVTSSEWGLSLQGFGQIVQGLDDLNQCIYILLMTKKGSDPLRPDFGCDGLEYLDRPMNVAVPNMVKGIIDAIGLYEPRVAVTKVVPSIDGGEVKFVIQYNIVNSVLTGQLDVTYGLS